MIREYFFASITRLKFSLFKNCTIFLPKNLFSVIAFTTNLNAENALLC